MPMILTAQTGYVGLRCPSNKIARDLIKRSGKLIAAPSANLFSHVSPTQSVHVFNDLYDKDITIIDGSESEFGVESTVIKIINDQYDFNQFHINLLRNGSIPY